MGHKISTNHNKMINSLAFVGFVKDKNIIDTEKVIICEELDVFKTSSN